LRTVVYGYPCSAHVDPVEKKPFFHFLPGSKTFSLATVGCNLHCKNCQNWEISQANPEDSEAAFCPPEKLVELTKSYGCQSLAYTYTDPIVYYEYTYDTAELARDKGIRNLLVTAGYINQEPWKRLLKYVDAARIDLKSISDDFYREVCSGTLKPVQDTLVLTRAGGVHLEVINLVIPTLNDTPEQIRGLSRWVRANLGSEIPLHFSQFYPQYKMRHLPPTSPKTLDAAHDIAMEEGLDFVYIGNVQSERGQNTYCPGCKKLLIERIGYAIMQNRLKEGHCPDCGKEIYGVWK
jgi:pyruvate formate lyase activating enzyme